jgi:hypothetical protein
MLILDDELVFAALANEYDWLPTGHDPAELATTTEWHCRLLIAIMKRDPGGKFSKRFHSFDEQARERFYARALAPAPIVTLLDPRLSLNTTASVMAGVGRIGFVLAGAIAAAVVHEAELAVATTTSNLVELCELYSVRLHHIQRK